MSKHSYIHLNLKKLLIIQVEKMWFFTRGNRASFKKSKPKEDPFKAFGKNVALKMRDKSLMMIKFMADRLTMSHSENQRYIYWLSYILPKQYGFSDIPRR